MPEKGPLLLSIPKSLIEAIESNTIIPVVGAGVSRGITDKQGRQVFPGWAELLERAAAELREQDETDNATLVDTFINIGNWQEAAKYAYEGLKGRTWPKFFNQQFAPDFNTLSSESAALPKAIWRISNKIITLNYDKILQWAYEPTAQVKTIDNRGKNELADFQHNDTNSPTVWHLHGHIDCCAELILTPSSYQQLYATNEGAKSFYQAALKTLETVSINNSLLFIGCSLDDAELLAQIYQQQALFADNIGPHFALVHQDEENEIKNKLNGTNIKLITFEAFGQPLLNLVNGLADYRLVNTTKLPDAAVKAIEEKSTHVVKIALLTANPLDQPQEYPMLIKGLKKVICEIDHFALTINNLNQLSGYDYLFVASTVVKNHLVIENEYLSTQRISFTELAEQIGNEDTKGLFVFVDQLPDNKVLAEVDLPILINRFDNKKQLDSLAFQLFNKQNLAYFNEACFNEVLLANEDKFKLCKLNQKPKTKNNIHSQSTSLPSNLDAKTVRNFVGREDDLEHICRKLLALEELPGILTIKGAGGMGKTTIVKKLTVALAERGYFADGISFIDCEFIPDSQRFVYEVAATFDIEQAKNVEQHIQDFHQDESRLIILDNLETLLQLDDVEEIKTFIAFICEYASVVVTSREILQIEGESCCEMRQLSGDEAVALFKTNTDCKVDENEARLLRHDILESLLDNNPLAITLITNNMLKGKKLAVLKYELETDLFAKISDDELEIFDGQSDLNIARKKSIYGSILYSYQQLTLQQQKAFEFLSLFPDGIDMESFKLFSQVKKQQDKMQQKKSASKPSMVTDKVLIALANKSMIENNNGKIKLQSIVGKFAEAKLAQQENKAQYYQNAFMHNFIIVSALATLFNHDQKRALKGINDEQGNLIKCIGYFDKAKIDLSMLQLFIAELSGLLTAICSLKGFIQALTEITLDFKETDKLFCDMHLLIARYFDGEFKNSYHLLQRSIPLLELNQMPRNTVTEKSITANAASIYDMEGEALRIAEYCQSHKISQLTYLQALYHLGEFNEDLANAAFPGLKKFEVLSFFGFDSLNDIDAELSETYAKNYITLMELSYCRAKIAVPSSSAIEKLIIINPYTGGLKALMFAFIEQDTSKANVFYQDAIKQLEHIKFYFVEAHYFYAKYLQSKSLAEFDSVYQVGLQLAQKHHYRYLQYCFEQLTNPTDKGYDSADYPLPGNPDFSELIHLCINKAKMMRKQSKKLTMKKSS